MKIEYDFSKIKITPLLETLKLESIDDSVYFSEKYSNYISNSRLGLLLKYGAKEFFEGLGANKEFSSSLSLGSALHQLVLQPDSYHLVESVNRPTAKAGLMADYLYNPSGITPSDEQIIEASDAVGYYKGKMSEKKIKDLREKCNEYWRSRAIYEKGKEPSEKEDIFIDEKSKNTIRLCLEEINNNKNFQTLLHPEGLLEKPISENEKAILLDIMVTMPESKEPIIYKLKSKLDNFTIDKESNVITVNDLKTTSKILPEFPGVIDFFHYDREIAMYSYLLKLCAEKFYGLKDCTTKGNFLVVETIPKYYTQVFPMTKELYKRGLHEFLYLLKCVAYFNVIEGFKFADTNV